MLELSDKDFRAAIIKMLHSAIMKMLKIDETIENLSKETEDIKEKQTEI